MLSPSTDLMAQGQQVPAGKEGDKEWEAFVKQFRKELAQPEASRTLDLLAALSHHSAMALGCYCENEARCHRSVLRTELSAREAEISE